MATPNATENPGRDSPVISGLRTHYIWGATVFPGSCPIAARLA